MKKITVRFILFISVLLVVGIICRITNIIQFYKMPTSSMEPTLKYGSYIFATNLKKPKRNSIIVFKRLVTEKYYLDLVGKKATFVYRLIAMGGDTLEIRNGYAFVNGKMTDDSTKLKFFYSVFTRNGADLAQQLKLSDDDFFIQSGSYLSTEDSATIGLNYEQYKLATRLGPVNLYTPSLDRSKLFAADSTKKWTLNNYGPLVIPENYCFIMGDNRHQANDSRFIGLIPRKDIIGTVF